METLRADWDVCVAAHTSRSFNSGHEIHVTTYHFKGFTIYERVYFPRTSILSSHVWWMIDYRLTNSYIPLIKQLGYVVHSDEIYDEPGAVYAKFNNENNLLTFLNHLIMNSFKDKKNMTRAQAMEAVRNGYAVGHPKMLDRQFVKLDDSSRYSQLIDENKNIEQFSDFFQLHTGEVWKDGWFIV